MTCREKSDAKNSSKSVPKLQPRIPYSMDCTDFIANNKCCKFPRKLCAESYSSHMACTEFTSNPLPRKLCPLQNSELYFLPRKPCTDCNKCSSCNMDLVISSSCCLGNRAKPLLLLLLLLPLPVLENAITDVIYTPTNSGECTLFVLVNKPKTTLLL